MSRLVLSRLRLSFIIRWFRAEGLDAKCHGKHSRQCDNEIIHSKLQHKFGIILKLPNGRLYQGQHVLSVLLLAIYLDDV